MSATSSNYLDITHFIKKKERKRNIIYENTQLEQSINYISITDQSEAPPRSPAEGSPEVQQSCPPGSWPGMRWKAMEVALGFLGRQLTEVRSRLLRHTTHLVGTICLDVQTHVHCATTPPRACQPPAHYLSLQNSHFSVCSSTPSPLGWEKWGEGLAWLPDARPTEASAALTLQQRAFQLDPQTPI